MVGGENLWSWGIQEQHGKNLCLYLLWCDRSVLAESFWYTWLGVEG